MLTSMRYCEPSSLYNEALKESLLVKPIFCWIDEMTGSGLILRLMGTRSVFFSLFEGAAFAFPANKEAPINSKIAELILIYMMKMKMKMIKKERKKRNRKLERNLEVFNED